MSKQSDQKDLPLSANSKLALRKAKMLAEQNGDSAVGTHHLLLALAHTQTSFAERGLHAFGILTEDIPSLLRHASSLTFGERKKANSEMTNEADLAILKAKGNHKWGSEVSTTDLLEALLGDPKNMACKLLFELGIAPMEILAQLGSFGELGQGAGKGQTTAENVGMWVKDLQAALKKQQEAPKSEGGKNEEGSVLEKFTTDLTKMAEEGKLDPVIGRENEVKRMMSILGRRSKNNPVLVGEAGVGKTALVEGLAQKVADGEVPPALIGKRILSLDLAGLVSGTRYRGDFEARLKKLLEEMSEGEDDVILFIDELHTIMGAGSAEGSMDTANILKPSLARGEIKIVGATTFDEYRAIEKDKALQRRFQKVTVNEPSEDETAEILKGIISKFEKHHQIKVKPEVLAETVKLSVRFLPERQLPDKAIDLIDEAMSRKGMLLPKGVFEKEQMKRKLVQMNVQKRELIAKDDFDKAADLHGEEKILRAKLEKMDENQDEAKVEIQMNDIWEVISDLAGVSLEKLKDEKGMSDFEKNVNSKVKGQKEAVAKIAKVMKRSKAGIKEEDAPAASFVIVGENGSGKRALVKAVATELFERKDALVKFDMSEFSDATSVNALIGVAAGFVGHDEGGRLTEKVRRQPWSLVLFDEIDKAHPKVVSLIEQILSEGEISDQQGRMVDFRNAVVVMTLTREGEMKNGKGIGFEVGDEKNEAPENEVDLKGEISEEILGKSEVIVLGEADGSNVRAEIQEEVEALVLKMKEKGIEVEVSEEVVEGALKRVKKGEKMKKVFEEMVVDVVCEKTSEGEKKILV